MRIYVAAKFEDGPNVKDVYSRLRSRGHVITHDWTDEDAGKHSGEDLAAYMRKCAWSDLMGVRSANAVLVFNHPLLFGGATEMGIAIEAGIPVYVVGADIRDNIFFHLGGPVRLCPSEESAIASMEREYKEAYDAVNG